MKIAGLDYSMTSPAICLYDDSVGSMEFSSCKFHYLTMMKKYDTIFRNVSGKYFDYTDDMVRFETISSFFMNLILETETTKVYIEGYSMGSRGKVFHIAENTGIIKYKLWKAGIEVESVPPTVIKKFATGKGNSDKEKMQAAFFEQSRVNLKFELGMTEKQWNPSSDIIDSYWICKYGYEQTKKGIQHG